MKLYRKNKKTNELQLINFNIKSDNVADLVDDLIELQNKYSKDDIIMKPETPILVVTGKVALKNSIVDWPDANHPGTWLTILRTIHNIDYQNLSVQLDGEDGPVYTSDNLPAGVGFYTKIN